FILSLLMISFFIISSRRRHTIFSRDWSSDVCSSDLIPVQNRDDLLTVTFTGTSGDAKGKSITLRGCWNGGKEWIVNFAAPAAGTWTYKTSSRDRGLNGKQIGRASCRERG